MNQATTLQKASEIRAISLEIYLTHHRNLNEKEKFRKANLPESNLQVCFRTKPARNIKLKPRALNHTFLMFLGFLEKTFALKSLLYPLVTVDDVL